MEKASIVFSLLIGILMISSCGQKSLKKTGTGLSDSVIVEQGRVENKDSPGLKSEVQTPATVSDKEGNIYKTVKIGKQTWMASNLKVTKYNDGTSIELVTDGAKWSSLSIPAYCWYNNDKESYKPIYGALYNGYAVSTGKLCPTDWHVPTDAEWTILVTYLGGENIAGGKLKETETSYWVSPNSGATNESGYTALPGGLRYHDGVFHDFGFSGYWWSSSEFSETRAFFRYMDYEYSSVFRFDNLKKNGFSIRCIRDY